MNVNPDSPNVFHYRWVSKEPGLHRATFHSGPHTLEKDNLLDELKYSNAFWRYDYFFRNRF